MRIVSTATYGVRTGVSIAERPLSGPCKIRDGKPYHADLYHQSPGLWIAARGIRIFDVRWQFLTIKLLIAI